MEKIKQIDLEKRRIEAKYIPLLRKIFKHMASDAKNLYLATKRIEAQALADNYRPEFLKVCRDAQRETIKFFGFDIRENAEEKGFDFKTAKYKSLIDYQIETKDVEAILDVSQVEKINNTFALDSALFVANSSEEQVDYITATNASEISDAEKNAVILFFSEQTDLTNKLEDLRTQSSRVDFEHMVGGSDSIAAVKKKKILEKIEAIEKELAEHIANKDKFIADQIEKAILEKGDSRSELIASQNVGMAESWSRQREAELVNENFPEELELVKDYNAILDSHTRLSHAEADFNPANKGVPVDGFFNIGGYKAKMPRDSSLPMSESANCRCQASYRWKTN